jgi:putative membrane protein
VNLIVRLLINAAALWVATRVVDGISYTGEWPLLFAVAVVFGVLNVVVRPILILLSLPALIVTLGLFLVVVNAILLLLTSTISDALDLGFRVEGFIPALFGALVVSIVSLGLSFFVGSNEPPAARDRREMAKR